MSLRPESSVSLEIDELGEIVFAADRSGPVIHRTPEELGIPRVVPDVLERKIPTMSWADGRALSPMRAAGVKRDRRPAMQTVKPAKILSANEVRAREDIEPLRVIGGEPVRMPADAVMGAEPLAEFIHERKKESRMRKISEETRAQILAEPTSMSNGAVGKKYGIAEGTVWYIRNKAGIRSTAKPGIQTGAATEPKKAKALKPAALTTKPRMPGRLVEIDPERPGTASALIGALAKIDQANERVKVEMELTRAELAKIVGGLTEEQQQAFLSAGLRAVLFV